jgi:hypothetical protein
MPHARFTVNARRAAIAARIRVATTDYLRGSTTWTEFVSVLLDELGATAAVAEVPAGER